MAAQVRYRCKMFEWKVILRGRLSCKDIQILQLSFAIRVMRPFCRAQLKGNTKHCNKTMPNKTGNQLRLDKLLK